MHERDFARVSVDQGKIIRCSFWADNSQAAYSGSGGGQCSHVALNRCTVVNLLVLVGWVVIHSSSGGSDAHREFDMRYHTKS